MVVVHRIRIETNRLILREVQLEDAAIIAELIAPLSVSRFLAVVPHPYTIADAEAFLKSTVVEQAKNPRENFAFAIVPKENCFA